MYNRKPVRGTTVIVGSVMLFLSQCTSPDADSTGRPQRDRWSPTRSYRSAPLEPTTFGSIVLQADARSAGKPLVHFWSQCVGAGRANEGLRASWLEQLDMAHRECGFQYVRFHGLFHSDMFVLRNGIENWQYVDDLFDRMLAMGVRPFVELGFNPEIGAGRASAASGPVDLPATTATGPRAATRTAATSGPSSRRGNGANTQFWWQGNSTPPDPARWRPFITDFTRHLVARYGIDEVRMWYFEVWNEPNLDAFYRGGTKAQYFELYRTSVLAVKSVDTQLRVGGPATSNFKVRASAPSTRASSNTPDDIEALDWEPIWVQDFLQYCSDNQLPLDFISTHPYPTNFAIDSGGEHASIRRSIDGTRDDLKLLRTMINASPYPKAGIELTEWSTSPNSRDCMHDVLCPAAFIAKTNLDSLGLVDALSYWTFTDVFEESGAGNTIFHGGFGLINYQGIPKPAFHAYRMLNALGDEVISRGPAGIVTREKASGKITALAYLYPSEVRESLRSAGNLRTAQAVEETGSAMPLSLTLTNLPENAEFQIETLDKNHGYALPVYLAMGSPNPPTREQVAKLKEAAWATLKETVRADESGRLVINRTIDPWSLVLVREK